MEIKTGRNRNIPCVVHHGNIFHHLYAKNHLLEKEECNKLMQGVCRRMRTTCFYLSSPTIVLGNTSRCPFSHLRRTKMQLHPLFYRLRPKRITLTESLTALISKFLSNSFHDNPLIMWQRGE